MKASLLILPVIFHRLDEWLRPGDVLARLWRRSWVWEDGKMALEKYFLRKKKEVTSSPPSETRCHRDNATHGNSAPCIQMRLLFTILLFAWWMLITFIIQHWSYWQVRYMVQSSPLSLWLYGGIWLTGAETLDYRMRKYATKVMDF